VGSGAIAIKRPNRWICHVADDKAESTVKCRRPCLWRNEAALNKITRSYKSSMRRLAPNLNVISGTAPRIQPSLEQAMAPTVYNGDLTRVFKEGSVSTSRHRKRTGALSDRLPATRPRRWQQGEDKKLRGASFAFLPFFLNAFHYPCLNLEAPTITADPIIMSRSRQDIQRKELESDR